MSKSLTGNSGTNKSHSKTGSPVDTTANSSVNGGIEGIEHASTSHPSYKIYVLGQTGAGKSSLVSQFITSEYRNAFADDIEENSSGTMVSVNIGGNECDLTFFEADPQSVSKAPIQNPIQS
jgi:Rad/Gem-related GTP binding protein 1